MNPDKTESPYVYIKLSDDMKYMQRKYVVNPADNPLSLQERVILHLANENSELEEVKNKIRAIRKSDCLRRLLDILYEENQ